MLKLATILDNPGEPFAGSRYRDPRQLRDLGYNGIVFYETTGLSGVDRPEVINSAEMRRWVAQQFDIVRQRVEEAVKAGLEAYISYDVLSLARDTVDRMVLDLTCIRRPTTLCPASDAAVARSVEALDSLLNAFPGVRGVVLRFGDNDAARLPYLIGNDIYSPHCARCSQLGRADRITLVLDLFYKLVVAQRNMRLIARAWNVRPNGLHDSVELCRRVQERLPGADNPTDDRFVLSFKFTQTDFWRYQQWNPASLVCGERPILYELQCQREFEGKGGIPNWQVPLWRDGCPEMRPLPGATGAGSAGSEADLQGLANVVGRMNLAGLWAWVRGGGWGGPFVTDETWIDSNVFAVPRLADNPKADPNTLAQEWIHKRLGALNNEPAASQAIKELLENSPEVIREGFYIGPFARTKADPWHPNADWIQDDLVNAQAAWQMIQRLPDSVLDEVVQEKQRAVERIFQAAASLQKLLNDRNRRTLEPLIHSLMYEESLFQALRDFLAGLVAYRRYLKNPSPPLAEKCRQRIVEAQSHWTQHTQRHGSLSGAPTAFREAHFWDLTQKILGDLAEKR